MPSTDLHFPLTSHAFNIIDQIPESDYDEDDMCLLSHESHKELNKNHNIVQFSCHGVNKYLNLNHVVSWVHSSTAVKCLQCRASMDQREVTHFLEEEQRAQEARQTALIATLKRQINDLSAEKDQRLEELQRPTHIDKIALIEDYTLPILQAQCEIQTIKIENLYVAFEESGRNYQAVLDKDWGWNLIEYNMYRIHYQDKVKTAKRDLIEGKQEIGALNEELEKTSQILEAMKKYAHLSKTELLYEARGFFTAILFTVAAVYLFGMLNDPEVEAEDCEGNHCYVMQALALSSVGGLVAILATFIEQAWEPFQELSRRI